MKFFIGLLIGIGIAGAVAFYLNKAQNPFVDKGFNNSSVNLSASAPVSSAPNLSTVYQNAAGKFRNQ